MSTAKDIFDAIMDSDNVNLLDMVKTGLYDRANERLEGYKQEVGSRLFKEDTIPVNGVKKPIMPTTNTQNNNVQSNNQNQQNNVQSTNQNQQNNAQSANQKNSNGNPIKKINQPQINT